ncbi:hypothetical protein LJR231_005897 [Phyllobacterium sp. LjRoot231]|uniref:hypothetical protein n=1 Tax=Phyllobacterium sp. LjRoot231 TaxID=3342289 RepID=UPI003ECCCB40
MDYKRIRIAALVFAVSGAMVLIGATMLPRYMDAIASGRGHGIAVDTLFMMLPILAFAVGSFGVALARSELKRS